MNEHETKLLAHRHLSWGYRLQRAGRVGDAMGEYRQSIALCPTAEAHTYLGRALASLERYEEAIKQCHIAISLDPDDGNPYHDIAAYLIELECWDEVAPWLDLALSAPRYKARQNAHYNLGRVHQHFGRYEAARDCYREALALTPDLQAAQDALATVIAGMN